MTLNLKTASKPSRMTLQPMMSHHHTRFGYKRFSSFLPDDHSLDFKSFLCPWSWPQQSNPIFHKTFKLMIMGHQTIRLMMMAIKVKFSCKRISSSEDTLKSYILIIWSFTVTLTLKTANQSFWKTIWLMMMHHPTQFGSKRLCGSVDIVWTNN